MENKDYTELENISNEWHELNFVASKFGIPVWKVLKAKEDLNTSNRLKIYNYLTEERES